jgi:hypothetical protein
MSDDPAMRPMVTCYTYDSMGHLTDLRRCDGEADLAGPAARADPPSPSLAFEHDAEHRVFRLTAPDGNTEVFRDNPTRYLCVAPDEETGAMPPVVKRGRPVYLYLCREQREAQ